MQKVPFYRSTSSIGQGSIIEGHYLHETDTLDHCCMGNRGEVEVAGSKQRTRLDTFMVQKT